MKALDLFCGLGGWSDGLVLEGFDVTGVEIEPKIAALYKHRVIVADVCSLNPEDFRGFDLIVGSPPCRNFSILTTLGSHLKWKTRPDPEGEGMRLVNAFLNFIEKANPSFWLMENVPFLQRYYKKAKCTTKLEGDMRRCLWGNFPPFLVPYSLKPRNHNYGFSGPLKQWERAKIPMPVARALGVAVRNALENRGALC